MRVIKRSLFARPSPIVVEGSKVRLPREHEWKYEEITDYSGRKMQGNLKPWDGEWGYRVLRVTNSTAIRPGYCLTKNQVDNLIEEGWTVTVRSKD